jgi:hypothetical protein
MQLTKLRPAAGDGRPQNGFGNFTAQPSKAIAFAEQVRAGNALTCVVGNKLLELVMVSRLARAAS